VISLIGKIAGSGIPSGCVLLDSCGSVSRAISTCGINRPFDARNFGDDPVHMKYPAFVDEREVRFICGRMR
jgi:hypothetical protein